MAAALLLPLLGMTQNGVNYSYTHTDGVQYDCAVYTDSIIINEATPGTATHIVVPDSIAYGGTPRPVREIGAQAFSYSDIESVMIPNTVTEIGYGAFEGCGQLVTATIGKSVRTIWETAFAGCGSLTTLNYNAIAASVFAFSGSGVLDDCDALATLNIGSDVTVLPEDLVASIYPLTGLDSVNIAAERLLPISGGYFGSSVRGLSITVPCSQLNTYQGNAVWSNLGTITADCGQTPEPILCDSIVYDTIHITDTLHVTHYDTVQVTHYDTVHVTIYDTILVHIGAADGNTLSVYTANGRLVIEGATPGDAVALYDMSGRVIATTTVKSARETLPLPVAGAYLLRAGQRPLRKVLVSR